MKVDPPLRGNSFKLSMTGSRDYKVMTSLISCGRVFWCSEPLYNWRYKYSQTGHFIDSEQVSDDGEFADFGQVEIMYDIICE